MSEKMTHKEIQALEKVMRAELLDLVEIIWELTEDKSYSELARDAGLSAATVKKILNGDWQYPRFLTIQKLAYACDLHVQIGKEGIGMTVIDAKKQSKQRANQNNAIRQDLVAA